jgi:sterol desaturase/sphingolipid hydroxylase (fatty acid hydroxylase superfamily)
MSFPNWLHAILMFAPVRAIPRATLLTIVTYSGLVVVFAALERILYRRRVARYATRPVVNDYLYCIFFNGGYFSLLVYPLVQGTQAALAPLKLDILPHMPLALATVTFYVVADFAFYWAHRLLHTKYFWPFHSVHHSQKEMTYLTTSRFHVIDVIVLTLVTAVPATIIGWPAASIAAVGIVLSLQDKLQHSAIEWTFGPLYPVVVSPRYHRIHHSADAAQFGRNYSRVLPMWDHLFGTANEDAQRPEVVGVAGLEMPERLSIHFLIPFRTLAALLTGRNALPDAPPPPVATAVASE